MKSTTNNADTQTLIGESLSSEYSYQEQEAELLAAQADNEREFAGYEDWSRELEAEAWNGAKEFDGVLIKRGCEHSGCSHFECQKSTRLDGFEI